MNPSGTVKLNEALRQELLALAEQDQSFLGSSERDPHSDQDQRQLLDLMGRLRGTAGPDPRHPRVAGQEPGRRGRRGGGLDAGPAHHARTRRIASVPDAHARRRGGREAEPRQVAFLVDRLSLVERNAQEYGTTICRQQDGSFGPPLLEDPDHVDERRRAVGLPPLEQDIRRIGAYYRRVD